MDTLTFVQPLSLTSFDSSPSRGALGIAVQFVLLTAAAWHTTRTKHGGTPEAPLLGKTPSGRREMSHMRQRVDDWHGAAVTERLYRDEAPPPLTAANEDGTCTIL